MHGSIAPAIARGDSFVITEEDYIDFLSRMSRNLAIPQQIMRHCQQRHLLFLGYGLNDWNLRVLLRNLNVTLLAEETVASWAIKLKPSVHEQNLWDKRRVKIYDLSLDEFAGRMQSEAEKST